MDNYDIAENFSLLAKLLDIHGENSFKAKSYSIAAYNIEKLTVQLEEIQQEKIFSIQGIGEATGKKIIELLNTGKIRELENIIEKTPEGVFEMMNLKGLGPKKISVLWKEKDITDIEELLEACRQDKLVSYKGFGEKTQSNILEAIEFYQAQHENYLYAQVEYLAEQLTKFLQKLFSSEKIYITGAFKRQIETIDTLEFVIPFSSNSIKTKLKKSEEFKMVDENEDFILYRYDNKIKVKIFFTDEKHLAEKLFNTTGTEQFNQAFKTGFPKINFEKFSDEKEIFKSLKLQYIPACLRESAEIIDIAKEKNIPELIQPEDIKGLIHCHSNWSDGVNTVEQLVQACIEKDYEYLVLSDHSKAAYYAKGLTEDRVKAQHDLVDELNEKYPDFKIFKSIESDILNDGSLDYSDKFLSTFDLIIISVHSNLKMSEEKAMKRLLNAIENPYTTILGHMTGRQLLKRNGFPVDHKKIIDACAANNVVIEVNANPRRLDMRWEWLGYALEKNVLISIDPDAHSTEEFDNNKYGVLTAQKGMLTKEKNLSSFSLPGFEKFLKQLRKKKNI